MISLWSAALALQVAAAASNDPTTVVRAYLDAMRDFDVARIHTILAEDYRLTDGDGSSRLYNRNRAQPIADWERGMNTRWTYRILSTRGDTVTALLEEENEYFTLLGLERGVQVRSYVVRDGRVQASYGHLFVTGRSSQAEGLRAFKTWLRENVPNPDPAMITPEGSLQLTKESVRPMLYWMRLWRATVDAKKP